ncbi:MAG: DUF87 domain-containing protein [Pseudomonadota bacterium]
MFNDPGAFAPNSNEAEETIRERNRTEGYVIGCDGTFATVVADVYKDNGASDDYWTVGQMISIRVGDVRIVGMLAETDTQTKNWEVDGVNRLQMEVALIGEVVEKDGKPKFSGGISAYPYPGAVAHRVRSVDLQAIFASSDPSAVRVGALSQARDLDAMISVNTMVERHFAVVGTTGAGKSTSVSLLVRDIVKVQPDTTVLILDPHNEYAQVFEGLSKEINEHNLDLPFWLFKLEEFVQVLFRGRDPIPEEVDILRDLIPLAKAKFRGDGEGIIVRKSERSKNGDLTSDTPVPYRISDLTGLIDERLGKLDKRDERSSLKALLNRISAAVNDPRYRFMFASKTIADNFIDVLSAIYRIPTDGKPITTLQLNGIPSEVVNAVVSVLCRIAFDLGVWSEGQFKTVVLCEEAHRYIPANREENFGPTRAAIARIAKEGRKYGVTLGLITQRPSELDPTILSQCSTIFSMRLGNDQDQEIMRKAISGASRSYINFLPSLANREAIAFGQGVSTPMRMIFREALPHELPGKFDAFSEAETDAAADLASIIETIRHPQVRVDMEEFSERVSSDEPFHASRFDAQSAPPLDPGPPETMAEPQLRRSSILKEGALEALAQDDDQQQPSLRRQSPAQAVASVSQTPSSASPQAVRPPAPPMREASDRTSARNLISRFRS